MNFDLRDLTCLMAVVNTNSFTRAAEELHITQPALSRKIRDLEARLGVPLLERTTRHVKLTKAGHVLSRYAQSILETCREAEESIARLSAVSDPVIELAYGSRAQFYYLLRLIDRLQSRCPKQRVSISHGSMFEQLFTGKVDAAVLMEGTIAGQEWADYRRLNDCGLSAFFPKGYFPQDCTELSFDDLRGHSLIFPSSGLAGERVPARDLHALVRDTLLAADFPEKAFRSGQSSEEFSSRILSEHIFGIMPDSSSIINNEMIDSLPIRECRTGFGIALAWNRSDSDTPAIKLLREAAEFISNQA